MDAARLEAIKARCAAATEGPWVRSTHGFNIVSRPARWEDGRSVVTLRLECGSGVPEAKRAEVQVANAEFIAHARTDLPDLLAEVERLRAALAASQAREAALREALEGHHVDRALGTYRPYEDDLRARTLAALALPTDDSALREERARVWEQAAEVAANGAKCALEGGWDVEDVERTCRSRAAACREGGAG